MKVLPIEGDFSDKVVQALSHTAFFAALTQGQVEKVATYAELVRYQPDEVIIQKDMPAEDFFVILSGTVRVLLSSEGKEPVEIGTHKPFECLGEVALLLNKLRTATVKAVDVVHLVRFSAAVFHQMHEQIPKFGLAVNQALAKRLQRASNLYNLPAYEEEAQPEAKVMQLLPQEFILRHRVLPLKTEGNVLHLGFVDNPNPSVLNAVYTQVPGMDVRPIHLPASRFDAILRKQSLTPTEEKKTHVSAPPRPKAGAKLEGLIKRMVAEGASDLHFCSGHIPYWRIDGEMLEIEDYSTVGYDEAYKQLEPVLSERHKREFEEHMDVDLAYSSEGGVRLRVNLFNDHRGIGAVLRLIPSQIMGMEQLGLPQVARKFCDSPNGIILVTGPTGSGKSTTLAAMLDYINARRRVHMLTLEDPIEFVHENNLAMVNQREIGTHAKGFARALRSALREDPDIVLVGEMRDLETISLALEVANTGHLVFATLHTANAISTLDRIIQVFPHDQQNKIRSMLADNVRGIISQALLKRRAGGRIAAFEVLVVNQAVSHLIREQKYFQIPSVMQTAKSEGNVLLNDYLARLVRMHRVDYQEALLRAVDKADFAKRMGKSL